MVVNLIIFINANILSTISEVADIVVALGVIIAAFTYHSTRKGNYLQTIENCSEEYRGYMRQIHKKEHENTLKDDILGLFHKQLFYIKNHYVPIEIKIEWLAAMHSILIDKEHQDSGLHFCKKDCKKSFYRVEKLMKLNKNETSPNDSKKKTKNIKKAYKKYYFTRSERILLIRNKQWKKVFKYDDKKES